MKPLHVIETVIRNCTFGSQANDGLSTARVMKAAVQLCFDTQEWELMMEHILIFTKRRSQLKTVSSEMEAQ